MKKLLIGLEVVVMMCGGVLSVNATLIDQGDGTIFDDISGLYWQQEVGLWDNMTYDQQIADISTNYVGWHMATSFDMQHLWSYEASAIGAIFTPNYIGHDRNNTYGRYDLYSTIWNNRHYRAGVSYYPASSLYYRTTLNTYDLPDDRIFDNYGAWVIRDITPVPEPATMLLFGTGLAGLAGFRLRKKEK
jgi:hypothetical protein